MSSPQQESGTLRAGMHADLVPLADLVLGAAARRELSLLELDAAPEPDEVDVVWAGPDDVSRLHASRQLATALTGARDRLRGGGLVLLPAPEPAELKNLHAVAPVAVQLTADGTAGPVVVWDFAAGGPRSHSCQELVLRRGEQGWQVHGSEASWFEVPTESELREVLAAAGFRGAQRLSSADTGLSCAVWAAVAPSEPVPAPAG